MYLWSSSCLCRSTIHLLPTMIRNTFISLWFTLFLNVCLYAFVLSRSLIFTFSAVLSLCFSHTEHVIITQPFVCLPKPEFQRKLIQTPSFCKLFSSPFLCFYVFIAALKLAGSSCMHTLTQQHIETATCRLGQ